MWGIEHYWIFILSSILLNITPGSDTIYILSRSIFQGKKAGIMSVYGIISGSLVHTLLAGLGLSLILMQSALAFNIVKWIGAAYLIWLGIRSIMARHESAQAMQAVDSQSNRKVYLQGMMTNVLNPKVALFYLAFIPQFVSPEQTYGAIPFILLGLTFSTTGILWCMLLVVFSSKMAHRLQSSRIATYMNKITGSIFILLGLNLLRTSRNVSS
ncbi:RhtB (resistance to homoserine/threonine) family protein [Paenibacillus sp. SORGH_AS306]|uniref:LysE family translocator n=1 Tax=unclassified Paenibacillus TaxID=185978 RepID=UPI002366F9DD|nr:MULTISPECIES: LysE family translocator [unclassified Paenibacillus]MDQ1233148.1 RhtB (resistance to homoserine/threonine) family protein [Paenibacillus sp. SORGH_AS_0306]MDR6110195.1 RhtB (resistance to homoserine/threonine) family protein [Paenibacillus sp. SORGH_AS_0338]WDF49741.1 LysE family translocator [Paenibacillus sp. KACC 21273]